MADETTTTTTETTTATTQKPEPTTTTTTEKPAEKPSEPTTTTTTEKPAEASPVLGENTPSDTLDNRHQAMADARETAQRNHAAEKEVNSPE